jgi:hypothetical protein
MELSKLTIGLVFIFLPGILALMISEKLTDHPERKGYELAAYTFVLGCLSHLTYFIIQWVINKFITLPDDHWLDQIVSTNITIPPMPVLIITSCLGVIWGLLLSNATNHSWLHKIAAFINVSKKFGDLDVWCFLMNSKELDQYKWIVVRDHAKNLMYQGKVRAFSAGEDPRELIIIDATVYENDSGLKMYDVKLIYLSLEKKNISLELFI